VNTAEEVAVISMPGTPQRRYASLAKAAEYAACNEKTLRRAIAEGDLTGYRLKRDYRVDLNELDEWLERGATVKAG
jgi:excisionase family DNA binding protein